ncbi:hypothetical protein EPUS_06742 [Endocarpon pusillum Z07020]|uniref:Uncharacterized protein n=1 Tax=Endocarpon pusillum (strain Z07020 / HMAS-L-300199) TaxID=1263415 RepID=U1G156_ENDPU|nr:uncharacterized protein EPUS_06742 [Endocarpon pusillum Z07020]ERF70957.1 hypothetical protein EPUS_06742 [Endocarpon pusillum Z07020]
MPHLAYPELVKLLPKDHDFEDPHNEAVLKAAILKFETDEATPLEWNVEDLLPCYTCLRLLDDDRFYTFPSHYVSDCPPLKWGSMFAEERACRRCDRKTGYRMKEWIREEKKLAEDKGYEWQDYYAWEGDEDPEDEDSGMEDDDEDWGLELRRLDEDDDDDDDKDDDGEDGESDWTMESEEEAEEDESKEESASKRRKTS